MHRYAKVALIFLLAVAASAWASFPDGAGSVAHAQLLASTRLTGLNTIVALTVPEWETQYDELRTSTTYNYVDWSQDKCSTPSS